MDYTIKTRSKHTATVQFRLIPSVSAIGTNESRRAVYEAMEAAALHGEVTFDHGEVNGFYQVWFESPVNLRRPVLAADHFITWLKSRADFCVG